MSDNIGGDTHNEEQIQVKLVGGPCDGRTVSAHYLAEGRQVLIPSPIEGYVRRCIYMRAGDSLEMHLKSEEVVPV